MNSDKKQRNINNVFTKYNYIMTTAQLKEEGFYHADIVSLLDDAVIEKVKRGYYHYLQNDSGSEILIINKLFPDAVLCMETALFYYEYTDRNPAEWNFAIDKRVSKGRTKIDYPFITTYRVEPSILVLGETEGVIDGEPVRIYDIDRTICDILRNMNKMDKEIFNKAIQRYVNDEQKNIPNLMKYAKILRVQKKVKDLIGVWL
ncbi:MAG: hypothetical protein R3Y35_10430 [Clostridia bacterium]